MRAQRAIVRAYQAFHHEALFNPRKTTFADARHRSGDHCKAHEWATYPSRLVKVCRRLQGVVIEWRNALEVIRAQDAPANHCSLWARPICSVPDQAPATAVS